MTFEEYEAATPSMLRAQAKECFDKANENPSWGGGATLLLQAQFYMQELDRRHDNRIQQRDLLLEVAVIILILGEIVLSVYGIKLAIVQGKDEQTMMDKQDTILGNLATSTQATASLLQKELDLEYALSINVEYNGGGNISVYNNSRSPVTVAGVTIGAMRPKIKKSSQNTIPDHNFLSMNLLVYNPRLIAEFTKGTHVRFPVELYLRNALGEDFVWKGQLTYGTPSGNTSGNPSGGLVKERWSDAVKVSAIP